MAGIWIKWVKGLATKREVLRMAGTLQRDRHEVAGRLMAFWEWCDDNVTATDCDQTGNAVVTLGALQKTYIDSIAGVTGFADAMEQVGWATFHGELLTIPNFARHNGETAKQRALTANRVSKSRQERNAKCNGASVTSTVTSALPEKSRVEKKEDIHSPPAAESWKTDIVIPNGWDESETFDALSNWRTFRAAKDGTVPQPMSLLFLVQGKSGAGWTSAKFAESVRYTISNGWKCLADPETSRDKQRNGYSAKQKTAEPETYWKPVPPIVDSPCRVAANKAWAAAKAAGKTDDEAFIEMTNAKNAVLAAERMQ